MKKQHIVAVVILIALIIVWFVIEQRESAMVEAPEVENFIGVDTSIVNKIVISNLGGAVTLNKVADKWYLIQDESYEADATVLNQTLGALAGMKVGNAISDNPANQIKFQVDTLTGSTVSLFAGEKKLSAVVIGKMSPDYRNTYVRLRDQNEVYLTAGTLTHLFNRKPSDWREHTIFDMRVDDVSFVEVMIGNEHYRVVKSDTSWAISLAPFSEQETADRYKVESFMASLCQLDANDFATAYDSTKYDFVDIDYMATITLSDGSSHMLEVAAVENDGDNRFARRQGDETVFILFDMNWKNIGKFFEDLLPDEKNS